MRGLVRWESGDDGHRVGFERGQARVGGVSGIELRDGQLPDVLVELAFVLAG